MKIINKKKYIKCFIFFFLFGVYMLYFNLLYKLLGDSGGINYIGIYSPIIIFFTFFEIGVPKSVALLIYKYDVIGHNKTKEKLFKFLNIIYIFISIFIILFIHIFSKSISYMIIKSSNLSAEINLVSFSLIFMAMHGIYCGYFEGVNNRIYSIISRIIQLLINFIALIIIYITSLKIKLVLSKIIMILCITNIVSYIVSIIFLFLIKKKHTKLEYNKEPKILVKQVLISNIKCAFINSLVYIIIVFYFAFDILNLNSVLIDQLNYKISSYESIICSMNIWGIALILPFIFFVLKTIRSTKSIITKYLLQKDLKYIGKYISNLYIKTLYFSIPISVLVCFCSSSIWNIMYSTSKYGLLVFQYLGILIFAITLYILSFNLLNLLKEYKFMSINFIIGIAIKCLFNVSVIFGINKLGFPGFYGAITTTFLSLFISSFITIIYLKWKYCINFEAIIKELFNIIISSLIMLITLIILSGVLTFQTNSNILIILLLVIYFVVAILIYGYVTYKLKTTKDIFSDKVV